MKYYLGVDGGGSKLNLLLYNENYEKVALGTGGGVTTSYVELSVVVEHMEAAVKMLYEAMGCQRIRLEKVSGTLIGPRDELDKAIKKYFDAPDMTGFDEGYLYLLAGGLTDKGGVTLSGTGDGSVHINGRNDIYHCGGYGSYMGEDGSGWWIGNRGMFAVTQQIDGWGPETKLYGYLMDYLGLKDRRGLIGAVYFGKVPHHQLIAGFARFVGKAAKEGDEVAAQIIREAGVLMAKKIVGCYKVRNARFEDFPVYACGGAWKSAPLMLQAHNEYLASQGYPATHMAEFEPIMGCIIQQMLDDGKNPRDYEEFLRKNYPEYAIEVK